MNESSVLPYFCRVYSEDLRCGALGRWEEAEEGVLGHVEWRETRLRKLCRA